jgi:hypothetical protein
MPKQHDHGENLIGKSESSFAPSHSFCGHTAFWRDTDDLETELAIKYIKQACGKPAGGVDVQVTWEGYENELAIAHVIGKLPNLGWIRLRAHALDGSLNSNSQYSKNG